MSINPVNPNKIAADTPNPYQSQVSGLYLSGFDNHTTDGAHLWCAEQAVQQDRDISVRYVSLAEIKRGDEAFPIKEAKRMNELGGALFIKLEPWASIGSQDDLFPLEDLLAGKHYNVLEAFAKGCAKANVPVFLTFGHKPQMLDKYPWGKNRSGQPDPDLYQRAFRYVHKVIEETVIAKNGTSNITWVWNPNVAKTGEDLFKYDPGRNYYDWIALDGFSWNGESFAQIFEPSLKQIKAAAPDLNIMIGEFAISAVDRNGQPIDRAKVFAEAVSFAASGLYRIGAFNYYNVNEEGEPWAVLKDQDKAAFAAALKNQDDQFRRTHGLGLFERTLMLADGSYLKRETAAPPAQPCGKIEGHWYDARWKQAVDRLEADIHVKEKCLARTGPCDIAEDNRWHKLLAKRYVELAVMKDYDTTLRDDLIKKAQEQINSGLANPDHNVIYPNWPPIDFIPFYFDLKMQAAELYRDHGNYISADPGEETSLKVCSEILSDQGIYSSSLRRAHDVGDESVGGIVARTNLISADDYVIIGSESSLRRAIAFYDEVIKWEKEETECRGFFGCVGNWFKMFFKHGKGTFDITPAPEVQYVGALAKLGQAEALVRLTKYNPAGKAANVKAAFGIYTEVLNWDLVGRETGLLQNGFMDLAVKSLVGSMEGCVADWDTGRDLNDPANMNLAAEKFERSLPWDRINQYGDLKKSLNIGEVNLSPLPSGQVSTSKWRLFINRLRYAQMTPRYQTRFNNILGLMPDDVR